MQNGSLTIEQRKTGPDVWCYRWWDAGASGKKRHRRIVIGTTEELRDELSATEAIIGLRREINARDLRINIGSM